MHLFEGKIGTFQCTFTIGNFLLISKYFFLCSQKKSNLSIVYYLQKTLQNEISKTTRLKGDLKVCF